MHSGLAPSRLCACVVSQSSVMFARIYFISVCLSTIAGDGNCTDMGGRASRDCICDTSNAFGIEVSLLYIISVILNFQDQGLCMYTRLPGPVVITVDASVHTIVFATRRHICKRSSRIIC